MSAENYDRNYEIYVLKTRKNKTYQWLHDKYGISVSAISDIVRRYKIREKYTPELIAKDLEVVEERIEREM